MSKKSAVLRGLPAVYAANLLDGIIFGAIKMAHMEDPKRTMQSISECVLSIFAIEGVPYRTLLTTYYRMEAAFLNTNRIDEQND